MTYDGDWNVVNERSYKQTGDFLKQKGLPVPDNFAALFHAARERSWKRADETGREATVEDALRDVYAGLGITSLDGIASQAVRIFFKEHEQHWVTYPDSLETIQELARRGFRVGLISNADDVGLVYRQVDKFGLRPYLSPVLSSASEPRWRKPDPRIFYLVSDAWKISPSEIVMVGDAPMYDVLGAHRAGMKAIWLDRGEARAWQKIPDTLANDPTIHPDATVHSLLEIPNIIGNW